MTLKELLVRNSRHSTPPGRFLAEFLSTLVTEFHARAACVWQPSEHGLRVVSQLHLDEIGLTPGTEEWASHLAMLAGLARQGGSHKVGAESSTAEYSNPLGFDLIVQVLNIGSSVHSIIEIFCEPDASVGHTETEADPFPEKSDFTRLSEYYVEYMQVRELATRASQTDAQSRLKGLATRLLGATTRREVAVLAVNDGRSAIDCDRVTICWAKGRRTEVLAMSNQVKVVAQSSLVKALAAIGGAAIRNGGAQAFAFPVPSKDGDEPEDDLLFEKAPAEYRKPLASYPSDQRPRMMLVQPIRLVAESNSPEKPCGVILVEQFRDETLARAVSQRAAEVASLIAVAMRRVALLESVPFLGLWKWRARRLERSASARKWLAMMLIIAAALALTLIPMEMRLPADGMLIAESRRTVFAPEDGVVRAVQIRHGDRVTKGQQVLTLESFELTSQLRDLTAELVQTQERFKGLEAKRFDRRLTVSEQSDVQRSLREAEATREHLRRQVTLIQERIDRLNVHAPADGLIASWNIEQTLQNRPVHRGDALLQQIDPDSKWVIDLLIPEDRAGYVLSRLEQLKSGEVMPVDFVVALDPSQRYRGTLREISARTDVADGGHVVRAVIDLDPSLLPPLRHGTEVKVRLSCGERKAGFVLFRELVELFQTYLWY